MRMSHSKLRDWYTCPRQFYYKHVEKLPQPPSHYLVIGNIYHKVIADLLKARSIVDLEAAVEKHMEAASLSLKEFFSKQKIDILWSDIYQNCERLWTEVLAYLTPIEVEKYYRDAGMNVGGIIDCYSADELVLDQFGKVVGTQPGPAVYDWKIKFSVRNRRTDQDAEDSDQLAQYCLYKGCKTAAFVEIPTKLTARINILQVEYTDEELAQWKRYIPDCMESVGYLAAAAVGRGEKMFPRTQRSNPLCCKNFCPFWSKCYGDEK